MEDPDNLAQVILSALDIREQPRIPALQTLLHNVEDRHLLLMVDNCEGIVDGCSELSQTLLKHCRHLHILATSRQAMNSLGEIAWVVPSLSIPPDSDAPLDSPGAFDAVRLFEERARSASPTFRLDASSAPAVAYVCRRVDGIPLAIELAAARLKVLSVYQIADRIDDLFDVLSAGPRGVIARHQTLRASLDWSYSLLGSGTHSVLTRCERRPWPTAQS